MKKKVAALALALVLIVCGAVGGTLAWLSDTTDPITNTFVAGGDIDITLTETDEDHEFEMIPGCAITKDPVVTVVKGSEACWLFAKVEKSENFNDFMSYEMADGWNALEGVADVWYRNVSENTDTDSAYAVLKDNAVTVLGNVTKDMLTNLTEENYPTLTITAYAAQLAKGDSVFTAIEAWNANFVEE